MSAKHTPGPWRIGITKHAVYQAAPPELRIALCSDVGDSKRQRAEEQANARLIAAAPELLEALRDAARWVEVLADDPRLSPLGVSPFDVLKRARAAIAKAEGKS